MIEPPSSGTIELEAKKLKRDLEGWREIVLPINSTLIWERPSDPGILFGGTTIFFLFLWYFDPNVLTTFAFVGLIAAIVDFLVPKILPSVVQANSWTANKERQLEKIARSVAVTKLTANRNVCLFMNLRNERPTMFYGIALPVLFLFAWLGSVINNMLLTYFVVSLLLLTPGVLHSGVLEPYFKLLAKCICPIFNVSQVKKNA